jgi:hypothetical protein
MGIGRKACAYRYPSYLSYFIGILALILFSYSCSEIARALGKDNAKPTTKTTDQPQTPFGKGADRSQSRERIPESDSSQARNGKTDSQMGCLRLKHLPSTFVILADARQRAEGAPRIGMEMFNVSTEKTTSRNGNAMMEDDKIC